MFCFLLLVEAGIVCVEILGVKHILNKSESLAETLEVYNFTFTQELDGISYIRVIYEP